jgi:flagellar L-ring protein precursor FlgH
MKNTLKTKIICAAVASLMLGGCGSTAERLSRIGEPPQMAKIENPMSEADYQPVSLPMPTKATTPPQANSLWQPDRQTFFKDQRAGQVGDILTVMVEIDDEAALENESERSRSGSEDVDLPALLGLAGELSNALPSTVDTSELVNLATQSASKGEGSIEREEQISLQLAAMIGQVLPNGNFVIYGRQQVRVNHELRELRITGIIRPEDIQSDNSISYEKIAEARIVYGGEGFASDIQKPRYGQEFFDIVFPF